MPPSVVFALILACTLGGLFHSVFGRKLWQLPCFLVSAVIGVIGGQTAGILAGWMWLSIGNVPMATATAGGVLMLWICWFFTAPIHERSTQTRRRAHRMVSGERRASA